MNLSRRTVMKLAASGLIVPSALGDTTSAASERKFLFILAKGGWDTLRVFTPLPFSSGFPLDPEQSEAEVHGITYVSSPVRPTVDPFFEKWGDRVCLINGVEIPSIAHDVCFKLLFTGKSDFVRDDWGLILGAHSANPSLLMPYLTFDGPSYSQYYAQHLVRLGASSQLSDLLTGDIFNVSTEQLRQLTPDVDALAQEYLAARTQAWHDAVKDGHRAYLSDRYVNAQVNARELVRASSELSLSTPPVGCTRDMESDAAVVLDCLAAGLSRAALIQDYGDCIINWDTHWQDETQDSSFIGLFTRLDRVMEMIEERTSSSGAPLSEELVVVVISEMAKTPYMNHDGGREHWAHTSAMLIGSGIRGGQVIGKMDDTFAPMNVDLVSGALDDNGTALAAAHLGATLLELGNVPAPDRFVDEVEPIYAALS